MFLLNSRLGRFSAASSSSSPKEAPLLPKLRGHFAEFLNEGYPVHLGILYLPTSVGLRYGQHLVWLRGFSWRYGRSAELSSGLPRALPITPTDMCRRICLPALPGRLGRYCPAPAYPAASPHRS